MRYKITWLSLHERKLIERAVSNVISDTRGVIKLSHAEFYTAVVKEV